MNEQDQKELNLIKDVILNTVKAEQIYLFGSFAYGNPTKDSDFDIYVILDHEEERPLRAMQKINLAISQLDIRSVDILAGYMKQFHEKCEAPTLERTIKKNGVILYERNVQLHQSMA